MSIKEIKDFNKLQSMLKSTQEELKYVKRCCQEAGLELAKNSFAWDGKEKNLVVQAKQLNEDLAKSNFLLEMAKKTIAEQAQESFKNNIQHIEFIRESISVKDKYNKASKCIIKAIEDFNHEIGTPYYDDMVKTAYKLGIITQKEYEDFI